MQYSQITEDFEIISRVRFDLGIAKIIAPYDRLFSFQDKLLLGFPRVGGFKIWKTDLDSDPQEVELVYKQIEIESSVFKTPHLNSEPDQESMASESREEVRDQTKQSKVKGFFRNLKSLFQSSK